MTKLIEWIKTHKLASVLAVALLFLLLKEIVPGRSPVPLMERSTMGITSAGISSPSLFADSAKVGSGMPAYDFAPAAPTQNVTRMVTKDTSLSLKVDDVEKTVTQIESAAQAAGGYLIDSNLSLPEGAASATISIRVPSEKRSEVLGTLKGMAVKVVSEYVSGEDVTDQYVDSEERLRILESTKTKFESILSEAKNVNEMLSVQRELLNLQQQIDGIKGQQKYLEGTTKLSRITVYLSTDELALPYAPNNSWRPGVVFKEAVRSLVMNLRDLGSLLIWVIVYAPIWATAIILFILIRRRMQK